MKTSITLPESLPVTATTIIAELNLIEQVESSASDAVQASYEAAQKCASDVLYQA
jgi:hypothetical protein